MFELVKCDSSEPWDSFVDASPQQNVFSTTAFLTVLDVSYDTWFLTDEGKPVLGVLLIEPLREDFEAPHGFYPGLFFAPSSSHLHSETKYRLNAVEYLLTKLATIYE